MQIIYRYGIVYVMKSTCTIAVANIRIQMCITY